MGWWWWGGGVGWGGHQLWGLNDLLAVIISIAHTIGTTVTHHHPIAACFILTGHVTDVGLWMWPVLDTRQHVSLLSCASRKQYWSHAAATSAFTLAPPQNPAPPSPVPVPRGGGKERVPGGDHQSDF